MNEKETYLQRLEKMISQLDWNGFPGLVGLISKGWKIFLKKQIACLGTVHSTGYEISVSLLAKCVDLLNLSIMGSQEAFTTIVVSIMPYCLHNFEVPTPLCISAAQAIAQVGSL